MSGKTSKTQNNELDETLVMEWLRKHPDFFADHPSILALMELPVDSGPAISMHQYQVRVLRDEKSQLTQKLSVLVKNVKTNHKIHSDLLGVASRMISLAKSDEPLEKYLALIKQHFALSDVRLIGREKQPDIFAKLNTQLSKRDSVCDDAPEQSLRELVFTRNADKVQSYALVPVKRGKKHVSQLVLGADDKERFRPGMGGEFLKQLAQLLSGLVEDAE